MIKRYGVDHYSKTKEFKEKIKQTCLKKYGVESVTQTDEFKNKSKRTKLARYNDENYTNREKSISTFRKTKIKQYTHLIGYTEDKKWICKCPYKERPYKGVCVNCDLTYITQPNIYGNRKYLQIETCTKKLPIVCGEYKTSKVSKLFFEKISKTHKYTFKQEYKVGRYFLDYFIPDLNINIEFNGDFWHANPKKYDETWVNPITSINAKKIWERDKVRYNFLKNKGIKTYIIWESDFNNYNSLEDIFNLNKNL